MANLVKTLSSNNSSSSSDAVTEKKKEADSKLWLNVKVEYCGNIISLGKGIPLDDLPGDAGIFLRQLAIRTVEPGTERQFPVEAVKLVACIRVKETEEHKAEKLAKANAEVDRILGIL